MKSLALTISSTIAAAAPAPSPRTREISAQFGLAAHHPPALSPPRQFRLAFPSLTLILGPSGSGKSTLLHQIRRAAQSAEPRIQCLAKIPLSADRSLLDCFPLPLDQTLALLSRAGLAEPRLWLRSPAQLSEGEQFRFRLARLMASSARLLIADEFAALLDRPTARALAWQLARFVQTSGRAALIATSHEDLTQDLAPTTLIRLPAKKIQPQRHRGTEIHGENTE